LAIALVLAYNIAANKKFNNDEEIVVEDEEKDVKIIRKIKEKILPQTAKYRN
jgi:hypothetical protein